MNQNARKLAEKFTTFNNEMLAIVENCTDEDWQKVCGGEQWTVGVVAHHVAAGHYSSLDLVKMIVAGETLPPLTMDTIDQMNAQHVQENADCTRAEVLALLRQHGAAFASYLEGLSEADLGRTGYLAALDGDVSAQQLVEMIILHSAGDHLTNMKTAIEP
jgi:hypothetical protein